MGTLPVKHLKGKYLGIRFSEIYLPGGLFKNGRRRGVALIHLLNRFKEKQTCFLLFIFTIYIDIFVEKKVKDKTLLAKVILFFISNSLSVFYRIYISTCLIMKFSRLFLEGVVAGRP